ncbi:MAG: endonuclease III domain-containing protein [Candidatus Aenigmatarchaeota archaeon]
MNLQKIYELLLKKIGKQNWWPAETDFEIIVGAILTQQASWKNVEKAIKNLKENNSLDPKAIYDIKISELQKLIKPSGFYKIKAQRLKNFVNFLYDRFNGDLNKLFSLEKDAIRKELLSVNGIGKETADSIILYSAQKPIFVVDAYTKRIFNRVGLIKENDYEKIKKIFESNLPKDVELYKEYHALIVELGKNICKVKPKCNECCLNKWCEYANNTYNIIKK